MKRHLDVVRAVLFSLLRIRTLGASVLAVDDEGKVLLVRQSYGPSVWRFPGGGVKRGESYRQAALREVREEVGLEPNADGSVELLGIYFKRSGHWDDHVALFVIKNFQVRATSNWEIDECGMFDPDHLPDDVAGSVKRRIAEWRGERPISDRW